jgi:hypothetical protein
MTGDSADQQQASQQGAALLRFPSTAVRPVAFNRQELAAILNLYGRYVAEGEWRDYAVDFGRDRAVFSVFRRSSEQPVYRIIKDPALARKQGMFAVIAEGGLILKRGQELAQVLNVLVKKPKLAEA